MTPWQFARCVEGWNARRENEHTMAVWFMWHGEAIHRAKILPPMKDFLPSAHKPKIDEASIKARLKAYQRKYNDERNS